MKSSGDHLLLLCFLLCCPSLYNTQPPSPPSSPSMAPTKVGVILDQNTLSGNMTITTINIALSDFKAIHPNYTTFELHIRDSHGDAVSAAAAAEELLQTEKVQVIIGPPTSEEAIFIAALGTKARVPIISFSASSPSLSPATTPFFIRATANAAAQCPPIAAVITAFGWRQAVLIHEDTVSIAAFAPYLTDALNAAGVRLAYRVAIPPTATDDLIMAELYKLITMSTRVFVVHANIPLTSRLFAAASRAGMMSEGYAWIVTDTTANMLGDAKLPSMQGVIGVRPYIASTKRIQEFKRRWKREFQFSNPDVVAEPSVYDLWAYDTIWAVATAASTTADGLPLRDAIVNMTFDGIAGRFRLNRGERRVLAFEIVNMGVTKASKIGMWTVDGGISKLGVMIWPGESTVRPRGWEIPASGRKLRIAVPGEADPEFSSFLKVERNLATNWTKASGFVIEAFEAAVAELPYALAFEYVPYLTPKGGRRGDYNQLVYELSLQKYDAVMGDITITANRSLYVEFTLPYTVSGLSMVVPVKVKRGSTAWIFLKPLTAELWMVSCAFFIFTGLVVWVLEHRINEQFRGPPANQIGTLFYFSFSTLVFAHKESVVNNLSRLVMIVWIFVVLILTSSYTASLTSMLTVQQLQPTVASVNDLIKNGDYVGFLEDSFVQGYLLRLGFNESRLRPYRSPRQYADALWKGSENGGVTAIVDEIPYLKVFLKDYCHNFTLAGPTYKTGGFGFAFPRGSPLAGDMSRAILNLTDGGQMAIIEKKWFGDVTTCLSDGNSITSNRLDLSSFWGLFLITGTASVISLCFGLFSFLYQHRDVLNRADQERPLWWRVATMAKQFDTRDLSFHTFRRSETQDGFANDTMERPTSPCTNVTESPKSIHNIVYDEGSTRPSSPPENLEIVNY